MEKSNLNQDAQVEKHFMMLMEALKGFVQNTFLVETLFKLKN